MVGGNSTYGKVGCGRKFGRLVLFAQLDVAELEDNVEEEEEEGTLASNEEPGEVEGDLTTPVHQGRQSVGGGSCDTR